MQEYKTVEEKAAEWNISPRHIQYLCRNGKIYGAVKRAGSWFIPDDTPSPARNSKAGDKDFNFVGTKKKIFSCAIDLFMLNGFDNVSLRDIADNIGIRQSTIYNHFKSKQEILDTIYEFYSHNYLRDRPSLQEMEAAVRDRSLMDIIGLLRYNFRKEYLHMMSDITKIIFQRIGIDERAKEIGKSLMTSEGIDYVQEVFDMAVESGRFAPFNTHIMALFINSIRILVLFYWILDSSPDSMAELFEDEQQLYMHCVRLIDDLKPPEY